MKLYTKLFILLSLFISSAASAQMLWRLPGYYGGTVYLLGSIHAGKADLYPLSREINAAFEASDYLVMEVKLNKEAEMIMQEAMFEKGRLEEGERLSHYISDEGYLLLRQRLERYKMRPDSLDGFRPWVAAVMLEQMELVALGYSPIFGIDKHFWHRAQELNKPVFSIEGAWMQAALLSRNDAAFQRQLLAMQLETAGDTAEVEALFGAWQEGNDTFFEEQLLNSFELYPSVERLMLTERNANMVKKIERYRGNKKGRSYFVIVGAAHLLGEEGIIRRLQAQDVNVTRIE